jgi:hypothetical protein
MKLRLAAMALCLVLMTGIAAYGAAQVFDGQTNVTINATGNPRCVLTSQDGKQMYTAAWTIFYGLPDQTYYGLNVTYGVRNVWTVPVNILSFAVTGAPTYLTVTNNMSLVSSGAPIALQPGAFAHVNVLAKFTNATAITVATNIALHLAVNCA